MPDDITLKLRSNLLAHTRYMHERTTGKPWIDAPHQRQIASALQRCVTGQTKRLIINMPPRSGKTDLAVKHFVSWAMGLFPHSQFIHASYSKRLAAANTYAVRAIMQHEAYQALWPDVELADDSKAKDEFRTPAGGIVYATGSKGTITGYGAGGMGEGFAGAVILDDPHKAGEAASKLMRENVIDWYRTTMESRKNSPDTPVILIMQRLHEKDLAGWLLAGGNGEEWESLIIPAISEAGESFWPEQFPVESLRRMEAANRYVFAGQYMQQPSPEGGGIFRDAWWRHYEVVPSIQWRGIWADTAQKAGEANDYSVFQCWGRATDGRAILLDQIRGKWEAPELLTQARAFWAKHKAIEGRGNLRTFRIEDKVSGTGLIQTLKREGVPVQGIKRQPGHDKVVRAMDAAPSVEAGLVWLPASAPWLSDFLHEMSTFPGGEHDDQVDPAADAIADIVLGRGGYSWDGF